MENTHAALIAAAILHAGQVPDGEANALEVVKTAREFVSWLDKVDEVTTTLGKSKEVPCTNNVGTKTNWWYLGDTRDPLYVRCDVIDGCGRWLQPTGRGDGVVYTLPQHARLDSLADTSTEYFPHQRP